MNLAAATSGGKKSGSLSSLFGIANLIFALQVLRNRWQPFEWHVHSSRISYKTSNLIILIFYDIRGRSSLLVHFSVFFSSFYRTRVHIRWNAIVQTLSVIRIVTNLIKFSSICNKHTRTLASLCIFDKYGDASFNWIREKNHGIHVKSRQKHFPLNQFLLRSSVAQGIETF